MGWLPEPIFGAITGADRILRVDFGSTRGRESYESKALPVFGNGLIRSADGWRSMPTRACFRTDTFSCRRVATYATDSVSRIAAGAIRLKYFGGRTGLPFT